MNNKERILTKSKTIKNNKLLDGLTKNQYQTLELIINAKHSNCKVFNAKTNCLYKNHMQPCSLNDISKAIGKKVDKLFKSLSERPEAIVRHVTDVRGRLVWMINPDVFWDYTGYELYYARWLFSTGEHKIASKIVDTSLIYGYYYCSRTWEPLKKISSKEWFGMKEWYETGLIRG